MNGAGGGAEDPRLRFRVWVAARMVDEVWVDTSEPGAGAVVDTVQLRHELLAMEADSLGQVWLIEVYDPAAVPGHEYVRFGTDAAGMVSPMELPLAPREVRNLFLPGDAP